MEKIYRFIAVPNMDCVAGDYVSNELSKDEIIYICCDMEVKAGSEGIFAGPYDGSPHWDDDFETVCVPTPKCSIVIKRIA